MTDDKKITDLSIARFEKIKREIQLIDGRRSFSDPKFCKHGQFLVDPEKAEVECGYCGEKLNPMYVLEKLCSEESRFTRERKRYIAILREFKKKSRCKCKHCGKFTDIRL